MSCLTNDRRLMVLALADIAEAVERFQEGDANVEKTLEVVAAVLARVTTLQEHRPAA